MRSFRNLPDLDIGRIVLRIIHDSGDEPITLAALTRRVHQELANHHGECLEPVEEMVKVELPALRALRLIREEPKGSFSITSLGMVHAMGIRLPSKVAT